MCSKPVDAGRKVPYECIKFTSILSHLEAVSTLGKKPCFKAWPELATNDQEQISKWAALYESCNWGVSTGQASGVFVLDIDGEKGQSSVESLQSQGLFLPFDTLTTRTGNGWHLFFAVPPSVTIRNSVGKIAAGLDVRGDGGYVVIPPSVHENGARYSYHDPRKPVLEAPEWLLQRIASTEQPSAAPAGQQSRRPATEHEHAYAAKTLKAECAAFAAIPPNNGLRNHGANKLAFTVAGLVSAGWLEHNCAEAFICEATAAYRAKDGVEAERTLNSGWSKGLSKPHEPLPIIPEIPRSAFPNPFKPEYGPAPGQTPINNDKIEVITMSDIEIEAIEWLWNKWLPLGKMVLLAGAPGTGKSTLAFSMAAIVSSGGTWPDDTSAEPAHVLMWSSEDDAADTIIPRLQAMKANLNNIHLIKATTKPDGSKLPFNPATDMGLLKAMMVTYRPKLLIIDPIVSAVAGDMNKSNEVRRGLQAIVDFASEVNCCVLGISHFAKGTSRRNRLRGSSARLLSVHSHAW